MTISYHIISTTYTRKFYFTQYTGRVELLNKYATHFVRVLRQRIECGRRRMPDMKSAVAVLA